MNPQVPTGTAGTSGETATAFPVVDRRHRNLSQLRGLLNVEDRRKLLPPVRLEGGADLFFGDPQTTRLGDAVRRAYRSPQRRWG